VATLAVSSMTVPFEQEGRVDAGSVLDEVGRIARGFAADRHERQRRCGLDPTDFDNPTRAGCPFTTAFWLAALVAVPEAPFRW
jgi:hypothetical protein